MAQTVLRAEELLSERDRVTGVCEAAGARFAFLFGSVIDTTPGRAPRDVDVAVSFHNYDFWTYLELREQLSRALGISEDRLDLVVLDRVNPRIKLEAVLTGVPMFVADPGALDEFAVDALFAYDDFLRFRRELHESLWKRIEGGLSVAGRQLN
ncbi:MAG: nucleotidyltransferase domain-containing protein, partial [Bacillota bacterium]